MSNYSLDPKNLHIKIKHIYFIDIEIRVENKQEYYTELIKGYEQLGIFVICL